MMNQNDLKNHIKTCTANLLRLAEMNCWNTISPHLFFILSDFNEFEGTDSFERSLSRNRINNSKVMFTLDSAVENLYKKLDDVYDINLYIFKANKKETIVEIQYYRTSNFKADYFAAIKDNYPMFHSKIGMPVYAMEGGKFDVNWESGGGLHHAWKNFVWRNFLYKRKIRGKRVKK